jgi:hypothetical protein
MSALRISSSDVVAVARRHRNADAGADRRSRAVDVVAGAEHRDQAIGKIARLVRRDVGGQHDCEFVAAKPGHEIVAAHFRLQPLGNQLQQPVADRMAEAVVDVLEQVEIDAQDRHALIAAWPRSSAWRRRS